MKKLISILFILITLNGLSQPQDMIVMYQNDYNLDGKGLNRKELNALFTRGPESAMEYNKIQPSQVLGLVSLGSGIGLITFGAVGIKNSKWWHQSFFNGGSRMPVGYALSIVGGGLLCIVGIPFIIWGNGNSDYAKRNYNSNHSPNDFRNDLKLDIGISQNGVGVFYGF